MAKLTLTVPEELKHKIEVHPEINWSEIASRAFMQKVADIEFFRNFKSKSTLTEKEALELGAELSRKLAKRYVS